VVPARDEAPRIAAVVAGLRRSGLPVLVIDDGSADGTGDRARAAGAAVVRTGGLGKGGAILAGCRAAVAAGAVRIILLDGDGQHDPAEAWRLAAAARTGADLVIGVRSRDRGRQPFHRRWANRMGSLIVTVAAGRRTWDSQSGYRCADPRRILALGLRSRRYDLETEWCIRAGRRGWRLREVPVRTIYGDKPSGMHPLIDTGRFLRAILRGWARGG
jgi:glycosyltransferase involved in cell wall biosynthesis